MNAEHNRSMTNEDEIDAALTFLGETEAPADIVSRVHQRLETAAVSQRARSGKRLLISVDGDCQASRNCSAGASADRTFIRSRSTQDFRGREGVGAAARGATSPAEPSGVSSCRQPFELSTDAAGKATTAVCCNRETRRPA